jgi:hypothetical protein
MPGKCWQNEALKGGPSQPRRTKPSGEAPDDLGGTQPSGRGLAESRYNEAKWKKSALEFGRTEPKATKAAPEKWQNEAKFPMAAMTVWQNEAER